MKNQEFVQVPRDLLTASIKEILSKNVGLAVEDMKNRNARMFVAHLSGILATSEPEMCKALCKLIQLKLIV